MTYLKALKMQTQNAANGNVMGEIIKKILKTKIT